MMKHQWDQPPPQNTGLRGDPVTADLNRYLAEQDRADARAAEVERIAGEVLSCTLHYDALIERLSSDEDAQEALFMLYHNPDLEKWQGCAQSLIESMRRVAEEYAEEYLEKLLEGGDEY